MMKVGILGGSFDPLHYGHLLVAQSALESGQLDRVCFMPAHRPPHKSGCTLASPRDRMEMVRLAIADNPNFAVAEDEIERGGVSYAVDTLRQWRRRHPDEVPVFIMGMDSLCELHTWRAATDLLALCSFIVLERPGYDNRPAPEELHLPPPWPQRLLEAVVPGRHCAISSSEIRQRVAAGRSIRYLVPQSVQQYIFEHGIYRP